MEVIRTNYNYEQPHPGRYLASNDQNYFFKNKIILE